MIDRETVFEIHRLHEYGLSVHKISNRLCLDPRTVNRYIRNPDPERLFKKRGGKLDRFQDEIARILKSAPEVSAVVIKRKIEELGYDGGISILKDFLRKVRKPEDKQAFIRFESPPGRQMQVDWAHFGSLTYDGHQRKLYCLAVIECYSRLLYVEFVHSQKQEVLHQGLFNAFVFFNGTPEELVVDNMLTAVIERRGSIIRFNDAFLDFLRSFRITPIACNVRAPYEKGKVENVIKYIRQNFWPLRSFADIGDVRLQSRQWLNTIANVRIHQTTGEKPVDRFAKTKLRSLPEGEFDFRETLSLKVYKDFAVRFDANTYTVPPWAVGKTVTLKADHATVKVYHQDKKIAEHPRIFERKKRIESPAHKEQVKKLRKRMWRDREISALSSLGSDVVEYLGALADARQPIRKNVIRMLSLKDEYGAESLIFAIRKAMAHKAYGADYIENILYQEMTPVCQHQPVKLKDDELNRIRLSEPLLAEYDAYVAKNGGQE
jgi:transposase